MSNLFTLHQGAISTSASQTTAKSEDMRRFLEQSGEPEAETDLDGTEEVTIIEINSDSDD